MTRTLSTLRRDGWRAYVLISGTLVAGYFVSPAVDGSQWAQATHPLVWLLIPVLSVSAIGVGVILHRPPAPQAWVLLGVALLVAGLADSLWSWPGLIGLAPGQTASALVIDGLYLTAYASLFAGILILIRRLTPNSDRAATLDGLILATAAAISSWHFLIQPIARSPDVTQYQLFRTTGYTVVDVAVLALAVRLWFGVDVGPSRSFRMIAVGLAAVLVSDTAYSVMVLQGTWRSGSPWSLGWFVFYVGIGAAALHPSVAWQQPRQTTEREINRWRFVAMFCVGTMLPLALVLDEVRALSTDASLTTQNLIVLSTSLALFALLVVRLNDLLKHLHETLRRERVARDANGAFVAAVGVPEIRKITVTTAAALLEGGRAWMVGRPARACSATITGASDGRTGQQVHPECLRILAEVAAAGETLSGPSAVHQFLAVPASEKVIAQVITDSSGASEGFLVVAAPAPSREAPAALSALTDAAELARARVGLGKVLAERESDRRLGRMLQHSTDIIVVIGLDLKVHHLSPGAQRLVGADSPLGRGASWLDAVYPPDRHAAKVLLELAQTDRPARGDLRLVAGAGAHRYVEMVALRVLDEEEPGYVLTCHDITERRALEQQLTHQAFHDSLTGLANRSLFRDRLEHALTRTSRTHACIAVLFIDLDDFKDVNDSLGHAAGDALLRQVTLRLVDAVREPDTVARLGGDEFAILLESVEDEAEANAVAQRIVDMAAQPVIVGSAPLTVSLSVGVAIVDDSVESADEAMRNADLALYQAKGLGKNQHAAFAAALHEQAVDRIELIAHLRDGVDKDHLTIHYQPIVDMTNGRQLGVEALARWQHPTRGLIGPEEFIPLAEETGLIVPMGRKILAEALGQVAQWQAEIPGFADLGVSVNLSVRQLQHPQVVDDVRTALAETRIDPATVVLEITESVLIPGEGVTLDRLHQLTSLGVRLLIDDFGTGYSSLSYLRELPVSGIKLAREFVATLGRGALLDDSPTSAESSAAGLVGTIRALAQTLGLESIIAEGVETPEQRDALIDLGYHVGQGFLMSRPMPANAMRSHLEQSATSAVGLALG